MSNFDQRRRGAELKRLADDCAKVHAAALSAMASIVQGAAQAGTARRPSWLRLAPHASEFYGFPRSHGIREGQIFEPKPIHFEPIHLKGGHRGQPCIPRGEDPLRGPDNAPSSPTAYFHEPYPFGDTGSIASAIFLRSTATRLASSAESTV